MDHGYLLTFTYKIIFFKFQSLIFATADSSVSADFPAQSARKGENQRLWDVGIITERKKNAGISYIMFLELNELKLKNTHYVSLNAEIMLVNKFRKLFSEI